jgi:hypothetical protein
VAPGATITNIVADWVSQLAAERLGPLMQATVPAPATAAQLADSITFLLSDDGTNINGAILASDGGWSALSKHLTETQERTLAGNPVIVRSSEGQVPLCLLECEVGRFGLFFHYLLDVVPPVLPFQEPGGSRKVVDLQLGDLPLRIRQRAGKRESIPGTDDSDSTVYACFDVRGLLCAPANRRQQGRYPDWRLRLPSQFVPRLGAYLRPPNGPPFAPPFGSQLVWRPARSSQADVVCGAIPSIKDETLYREGGNRWVEAAFMMVFPGSLKYPFGFRPISSAYPSCDHP